MSEEEEIEETNSRKDDAEQEQPQGN